MLFGVGIGIAALGIAADEALSPSQSPLRNVASSPERPFYGPGEDSEKLPSSVGRPPARPQVPIQTATLRGFCIFV